jgi:hypothetical protein
VWVVVIEISLARRATTDTFCVELKSINESKATNVIPTATKANRPVYEAEGERRADVIMSSSPAPRFCRDF